MQPRHWPAGARSVCYTCDILGTPLAGAVPSRALDRVSSGPCSGFLASETRPMDLLLRFQPHLFQERIRRDSLRSDGRETVLVYSMFGAHSSLSVCGASI